MSSNSLSKRPEYMKQVKEKVGNYCAYRERCSQEVREKLEQYQCSEDEIEDLLCYFQSEGFLDDSRFVEAYAKDKFRQNKWGKIKIRQYLKQKRLPNDLIQAGLNQIPSDEYDAMIDGLVRRKYELVKGANDYIRSNKTAQSIIAKGFEPDLVWEVLKTIDDQSN